MYEGSGHGGNGLIPELHPIGAMRISSTGALPRSRPALPDSFTYGGSAHGGTAFGPGVRLSEIHHGPLSSSV